MFNRRGRCCFRGYAAGCFFIAVGTGVFLAYAIPRYILVMLFGLSIIGIGIGLIGGRDKRR